MNYSHAYDNLPVGVTVWSSLLVLKYANEAACIDTGLPLSTMQGASMLKLLPRGSKLPHDINPYQYAQKTLRTRKTYTISDVPIHTVNGSRMFSFTFSMCGSDLVCSFQSDAVVYNSESMREVERKLLMLENLDGYAAYTDVDGLIISVNKLPPNSKYETTEVENLYIGNLFPSSESPHVDTALGKIQNVDLDAEYEFLSRGLPEGHWFQTRVKTVTLPTDGKVLLWVSWDITRQKQIQDQISNANEDLEQFAYIVSHDLQEPIRTIAAYVDVLVEDYGDLYRGGEPEEFMGYIRDSALRQQKLIQDLLMYSRTSNMKFESTNIYRCFQTVTQSLENLIGRRSATVTWEGCQDCEEHASETYVTMALQNLIVNAIKYTPKTRTPLVKVKCEKQGAYTVLSVSDNGIGIEDRYHDMVFRMFKRLHPPGSAYEGNGIGLPVCKRIARQHGGDCWLDSTPGEGSTFHISLRQPLDI